MIVNEFKNSAGKVPANFSLSIECWRIPLTMQLPVNIIAMAFELIFFLYTQ